MRERSGLRTPLARRPDGPVRLTPGRRSFRGARPSYAARGVADKIADDGAGARSGGEGAIGTPRFRAIVSIDYAVGVHAPTRVFVLDASDRRRGPAVGVQDLGIALGPKAFRSITWRDGTNAPLSSRFCFRRVKVAADDGLDPGQHEPVWLLLEWPEGESKPTKFALTTLPRRMSKKEIVRTVKGRWRTERVYEDLKGELGLDHFEGRSFPGWHHHIMVVLCCFAFVIADRAQHFPPSARRQGPTRADARAAVHTTSPIPSSPRGSQSHACSQRGFHGARAAIDRTRRAGAASLAEARVHRSSASLFLPRL